MTVSYPIAGDSIDTTNNSASRNVALGENELSFVVGSAQGGSESVVQAALAPGSGPVITSNYDWRAPLSYNSSSSSWWNIHFAYTHYFSNGSAISASGYGAPTRIVISGPDRTLKDLGNCACNVSNAGTAEGDPIDAGTGNKFQAESDFVGAIATGLSLTRSYNSSDPGGSATC